MNLADIIKHHTKIGFVPYVNQMKLEMNFTTYFHAPTKKFQKLEILFLNNLYGINSSFRLFDTNNLFLCIIHDKSIMKIVAKFFHDILLFYDNQCIT